MPADEHIRYVPESPSVDYRIVILAAIASLLLVAGAIGVLYAAYQRSVRVKDVPAPQTFSQPRVAPSKDEVAERTRTRIRAKTAARNLAMGRPAAHVGANSDRARHANTCPAWQ